MNTGVVSFSGSEYEELGNGVGGEGAVGSREFIFTEWELQAVLDEVMNLSRKFPSIESKQFAHECENVAGRLPKRLRDVLLRMRNVNSRNGFLRIRGYFVDDEKIGPSPVHWDAPWDKPSYLREEIFQCLISSVLGSVFGWRTQENGRFLRHIVPVEADKFEQLGGSSATTLVWHTEEAFHPARADFLTLACYRNNERATTLLVAVDDLELNDATISILMQDRFIIEPDKSHLPENNKSEYWELGRDKFKKINDLLLNPSPCAALYGRPGALFLRVDQAFMAAIPGDAQAEAALNALYQECDKRATYLILEPGDLLIIDNALVVHGRSIYNPDYGPKQRWLRRVNVSTSWRTHFDFQEAANSRVME